MKKLLGSCALLLALSLRLSAQTLFTEVQAQVSPNSGLTIFRVLGDRESKSFSAYGIHVIAPDGSEHMLDEFDATFPDDSEADVLLIEDLNFDGYADLRMAKYMFGGANVPYLVWLFNPQTLKFETSEAFQSLVSLQVDNEKRELISRRKVSSNESSINFYRFEGGQLVLARVQEITLNPDGSSIVKLFEIAPDQSKKLVETKTKGPNES